MAAARRLKAKAWVKGLGAALISMLLITGCWNNQPVEHRDLVMALGVEPAPHQQIRVLLQVPTKSGLIQIPGAAGAGGGSSGPNYFVVQGVGKTLSDALSNAQNRTDRELYLTQAQILLFSTRLSAHQFNTLLDSILRIGTIDKDVWVAATSEMGKVVNFAPMDSPHIPGLYFTTVFNCSTCQNVRLATRLWDVYEDQYSNKRDLSMPYLQVRQSNFSVDRLAIYHHGRIADVLTPQEAVSYGWAMGLPTRGTLSISSPYGMLALRDLNGKAHYHLSVVNGVPHELVTVYLHGQLNQLSGSNENLFRNIATIENLSSRAAARAIAGTLADLQKRQLDPLQLVLPYVWHNPQYFTAPGSIAKFYARMHIAVRAKVTLRNLSGKT